MFSNYLVLNIWVQKWKVFTRTSSLETVIAIIISFTLIANGAQSLLKKIYLFSGIKLGKKRKKKSERLKKRFCSASVSCGGRDEIKVKHRERFAS